LANFKEEKDALLGLDSLQITSRCKPGNFFPMLLLSCKSLVTVLGEFSKLACFNASSINFVLETIGAPKVLEAFEAFDDLGDLIDPAELGETRLIITGIFQIKK
jgi:hypothetical protein